MAKNTNEPTKLAYKEIWEKTLAPNEEVKYEFSIGERYRYVGLCFFLILGVLLVTQAIWVGVLAIISVILYFGWFLKISNAYAFTNKRVLIYQGWLSTELISVDYDKITDIIVEEPVLENLYAKSGRLLINTAGSPQQEIKLHHIQEPYEVKQKLDSIRDAYQKLRANSK